MNPTIHIRNETVADINAITEVTISAFKKLEISDHTKQFIIEALRAAKALSLSLVAEIRSRVVGHIAFSPVTISDGTIHWYGLGPVSVLPEYQKRCFSSFHLMITFLMVMLPSMKALMPLANKLLNSDQKTSEVFWSMS
jgi:putative acetyltransferase